LRPVRRYSWRFPRQEVQPPKTEEDNGYSQIAIFAKALELIRQDYVDENKTSYHDLVTAAMKGMLSLT